MTLLQQARREYEHWLRERAPEPDNATDSNTLEFLKLRIGAEKEALERLRRLYAEFDRALSACRTLEDQRELILNFARELGATGRELKKDRAVLARWFGADVMRDRYQRRHSRCEQYIAFLLGRLGAGAAGSVTYEPKVYGGAEVRFIDTKLDVDGVTVGPGGEPWILARKGSHENGMPPWQKGRLLARASKLRAASGP